MDDIKNTAESSLLALSENSQQIPQEDKFMQDQNLSSTWGCVRREGVVVLMVDDKTRSVTQRSRVFTVRVHRGWRDGFEIKFAPTGSELQSVMFVIRERAHDRFDRVNEGKDIATWVFSISP